MSNRFATRIGLPSADERPADAHDVVAFHEPTIGAHARTKGSLFLLAQLTGGSPTLANSAREALEAIQHDYYYDLSAGVLVALSKAMASANRRLYHQRRRLVPAGDLGKHLTQPGEVGGVLALVGAELGDGDAEHGRNLAGRESRVWAVSR